MTEVSSVGWLFLKRSYAWFLLFSATLATSFSQPFNVNGDLVDTKPVITCTGATAPVSEFENPLDKIVETRGGFQYGENDRFTYRWNYRWPVNRKGFFIPYKVEIANDLDLPDSHLEAFHLNLSKGIEMMENSTPFRFVKYEDFEPLNERHLVFKYSKGRCSAPVGAPEYYESPIYVSVGATCGSSTVAHEVMHALNLVHEMSVHNRAKYIKIHWDRIEDGSRHNFVGYQYPVNRFEIGNRSRDQFFTESQSAFSVQGSHFDYYSYMMYHPSAAANSETLKGQRNVFDKIKSDRKRTLVRPSGENLILPASDMMKLNFLHMFDLDFDKAPVFDGSLGVPGAAEYVEQEFKLEFTPSPDAEGTLVIVKNHFSNRPALLGGPLYLKNTQFGEAQNRSGLKSNLKKRSLVLEYLKQIKEQDRGNYTIELRSVFNGRVGRKLDVPFISLVGNLKRNQIDLFPNPVVGGENLNVVLKQAEANTRFDWFVSSISGQVLNTGRYTGATLRIPPPRIPGVYFFGIRNSVGKEVTVKKFVVKNL